MEDLNKSTNEAAEVKEKKKMVTKKKAVKQTAEKTESGAEKTYIYIGPNAKDGALIKNSLYIGGLPTHIQKVAENNAVKRLFVDVNELTKAQKELGDKTSPLYAFYKQAEEILKQN